MFRKIIILQIVVLGVIFAVVLSQAFSKVIEEKGKTYICTQIKEVKLKNKIICENLRKSVS